MCGHCYCQLPESSAGGLIEKSLFLPKKDLHGCVIQ